MPVWIRSLSVMIHHLNRALSSMIRTHVMQEDRRKSCAGSRPPVHATQREIVFVLVRSVAAPQPPGQEQTASVAVSDGHEPLQGAATRRVSRCGQLVYAQS